MVDLASDHCEVDGVKQVVGVHWGWQCHCHRHCHCCSCCRSCRLLSQLEFDVGQGVLNHLSNLEFKHLADLHHCGIVGWGMAMVGGWHCCIGGSVCYMFWYIALSTRGC